ncbi:uncharacterized protein [Epargyreus clarus]|uniref:uncharacterized protein n=1 Tax=Epargyreus clarus TaxID=520877 RepID=UPI003C2EEA97
MKFFNLFILTLAILAMMLGGSHANPKGAGGAIKKGGKVIKHGLGALGAIGTGHEIYEHVKNRG